MKKKKINIKILMIVMISLVIGGLIGYGVGFANGVKFSLSWGVDKAMYFLKLKGIEVDVNKELIKEGLYRYQNNIGGCWEIENASLHNFTRN